MAISLQTLTPGWLTTALRLEAERMDAGKLVGRLWAKDASLWPVTEREKEAVKSNLGWLDLPEKMGRYMAEVSSRTANLEQEGFEDLVFIGMGSSNLAAEAIENLPTRRRGKRFFVLDTTAPGSIRAVERTVNLSRTLFVFASKFGKHIETHAILLHFLEWMRSAGVGEPGSHFIAVTEADSYLAVLARQYGFRHIFHDPPGIRGRYSSLIHFGLLLAGVCGVDPGEILSAMTDMRDACTTEGQGASNPAGTLASLLAAGAREGAGRLLLLPSASMVTLTRRIAQSVGESTGKRGKGIVPIFGPTPRQLERFQQGCMAAALTMQGDDTSQVKQAADALEEARVPLMRVELGGVNEVASELFKWEVASALTCALLEVDPFDEPDLADAREASARILETLSTSKEVTGPTVRVRENGIELYAEKRVRQEISTLSLADALRTFFGLRKQTGYLALLSFLERTPESEASLARVRDELGAGLGIPVVVNYGPRYLHSLAQLYKGGPANGLFVMLTAPTAEDVSIPGAEYTFGQLHLALALGDFEALLRRDRLVVRLQLAEGAEAGLVQMERAIERALAIQRRLVR